MQKHTKVYFAHFGYTEADFIACEYCGARSVDIHHIKPRSFFGSKYKGSEEGEQDHISNLMALCRDHHDDAGASKLKRSDLQEIHNKVLFRYENERYAKDT